MKQHQLHIDKYRHELYIDGDYIEFEAADIYWTGEQYLLEVRQIATFFGTHILNYSLIGKRCYVVKNPPHQEAMQ